MPCCMTATHPESQCQLSYEHTYRVAETTSQEHAKQPAQVPLLWECCQAGEGHFQVLRAADRLYVGHGAVRPGEPGHVEGAAGSHPGLVCMAGNTGKLGSRCFGEMCEIILSFIFHLSYIFKNYSE